MDPVVEPEADATTALAFNSHVEKAGQLIEGLPTPAEFDESFLSFVGNEENFRNLMAAIAEYDSAMLLKKEHPADIIDLLDVEKLQTSALELRSAYMNKIIDDIGDMIREGGREFAVQDMQIARILEMPDDTKTLDSLNRMITNIH